MIGACPAPLVSIMVGSMKTGTPQARPVVPSLMARDSSSRSARTESNFLFGQEGMLLRQKLLESGPVGRALGDERPARDVRPVQVRILRAQDAAEQIVGLVELVTAEPEVGAAFLQRAERLVPRVIVGQPVDLVPCPATDSAMP